MTVNTMCYVTLTTDSGSIELPKQDLTIDAMNTVSNGQAKTVASKLVHNWRILMRSECNVRFFNNLIKHGISTRDIKSFISNQAKIRKVHRSSDEGLSKVAMRSKLNDACAFIQKQKRVVSKLKQELLVALSSKRFKFRKII